MEIKYDALGNWIERDWWTADSGVTIVVRYGFDGWKTHLDVSGRTPSFVGMENFDTWLDMGSNNESGIKYDDIFSCRLIPETSQIN